jgi:hypothetical protein
MSHDILKNVSDNNITIATNYMGCCVFPELSPAEISILQIIHLVTGTSREQPEREFSPIKYPKI